MRIHLDHNATTPPSEEVLQAMLAAAREFPGNPASGYASARAARNALEDAREEIAALLGMRPGDQLVFTSGGTEANNLALVGLAGAPPEQVIISAIEHPSVSGPAAHLQRRGHEVREIPVTTEGLIDETGLAELLAQRPRLASIIYGSNETGVLQDIAGLCAACHAAGVPLHTDAVQVVGKLPVNFAELNVTAMTVAAHKFHGPRGIGALCLRQGVNLAPQLFGGQQQNALRPGTESVALAIGMATALRLWHARADEFAEHLTQLRETFEAELREQLPEIVIHSSGAPRLPHTSNVAFPGIAREELLLALDVAGVEGSAGSACASGSTEPSPALRAMGVPADHLEGSLRFSFGRGNTQEEVREAVSCISLFVNKLRRHKSA